MNQNPELKRRENIERAIISNCLMDNKIIPTTISEINPSHFYFNNLRNVFAEIINTFQNDKPIDVTLLIFNLAKQGDNQYGNLLIELMDEYITSAQQMSYIRILQEYKLREIALKEFKESIRKIKKNEDIFDVIQKVGDFTFSVQYDIKQKNEFVYKNSPEEFDKYYDVLTSATIVKSGLHDLDKILHGFYPSDLIFIGARPSVGKTALGLSIFNDIVINQNKTAVFFSLEMPFGQIYSRLMAMNTTLDSQRIRQGLLTGEELKAKNDFGNVIRQKNFVIDDSGSLNELELKAKLQIYIQKYGVEIAFIDYIGLMKSSVTKQTKNLEIGHISNSIKQMAKSFNIPIVCLVQLNREVEKRADQRPTLADLRDSGELEQDADVVVFIHRPLVKDEEARKKGNRENQGELIVAKQRNGATGVCDVMFNNNSTKFTSIARGYEVNPNDIPKQSYTKYYNETENDRDFDETYKDGSQFPF